MRRRRQLDATDDGKNPYGVKCPTCYAKPGEPCTSRSWRNPTVYHYPHVTREYEAEYRFEWRQMEARRAIARRRLETQVDVIDSGDSQ